MPTPDIESILRTASKIHLRGGVVGKICVTLLVAVLGIAGIAWSLRTVEVAVLGMLLIFLLTVIVGLRLISFADRNPQSALLEGAEFLVHQQLTMAQKGQPPVLVEERELTGENLGAEDHGQLVDALQPDASPPAKSLQEKG